MSGTPTTTGGPCFACLRRDDGIGYLSRRKRGQIIWSCRDHIHFAWKADVMSKGTRDVYEQRALKVGGEAAGAYLDSIGKTDLADLDEVQWMSFLRKMFDAYSHELSKQIEADEAPF